MIQFKGQSLFDCKGLARATRGKFYVYFVTAARRSSPNDLNGLNKNEKYLRSGMPLASNVLQLLSHDAALGEIGPYIPFSRLNKYTPSVPGNEISQKYIASAKSEPFPALSILHSQFTVVSLFRNKMKQVMLLSIDTMSTMPNVEVMLTTVDLLFSSGVVRQISQSFSEENAIKIKSGEQVALLYEVTLSNFKEEDNNKQPGDRVCNGNIVASVVIAKGCKTRVILDCKEGIGNAIQRAVSTEESLDRSPKSLTMREVPHRAFPAELLLPCPMSMLGITITISGPQIIRVGEAFTWNILVVNKTKASRNCSLTLLQGNYRGNDTESGYSIHLNSEESNTDKKNKRNARENAIALGLEGPLEVVRAKRPDIICLSPDVWIK